MDRLPNHLINSFAPTALEFRCPHCQKLYTTDVNDVCEEVSYFECFGCQSFFALERRISDASGAKSISRPGGTSNVGAVTYSTYLVPVSGSVRTAEGRTGFSLLDDGDSSAMVSRASFQIHSEVDFKVDASSKVTNCPKCGSVSAMNAKECYCCGVIFERYKLAHSEGEWAVHPSLVRRWRELVIDFDSAQKHEDFIQDCHSLNSLPFARKKYVEMKGLLGQDIDCDRYIKRVDGVARQLSAKNDFVLGAKEARLEETSNLKKTMISIPFFISSILIIIGMAGAHQRNLIGLGISLAILSYGVIQVTRKSSL